MRSAIAVKMDIKLSNLKMQLSDDAHVRVSAVTEHLYKCMCSIYLYIYIHSKPFLQLHAAFVITELNVYESTVKYRERAGCWQPS